MPLYQLRMRRVARQLAAASGDPWPMSERIPAAARFKVAQAIEDNLPRAPSYVGARHQLSTIHAVMRTIIERDWGFAMSGGVPGCLSSAATSDAEFVDIVEAWFVSIREVLGVRRGVPSLSVGNAPSAASQFAEVADQFRDRLNEIFDDHDIAWQLVDEQMMPRSSMAMHATIVAPVLALTSGASRFASVEKAYQDALSELKPGGRPADAITDAGTALQEMLRVTGATGKALGSLLADARKKELIAPYDTKLADAIGLVGDWVSADRSARGDSHVASDANREDGWLAVHVAGALILRLASGTKR